MTLPMGCLPSNQFLLFLPSPQVVFLLRRTYARWTEQHGAGIGCRGRNASTRLQSRNSRGGSVLGRSVVSTQCYSSVPASPEVCCNINRLSFSSSTTQGTQLEKDKQRQYSPSEKNSALSPATNGPGKLSPTTRNILPNHHHRQNSTSPQHPAEQNESKEENAEAEAVPTRWSATSPPPSSSSSSSPPRSEEMGVFEMKPQKCVRLSPTTTPTPTGIKNGIRSEHQF